MHLVYQPICSMTNYLTVSNASYYLLKSDAVITYMTISNIIKFLSIGNASITYQTINNRSNYTNSTFNTLVNTFTNLSGILYIMSY